MKKQIRLFLLAFLFLIVTESCILFDTNNTPTHVQTQPPPSLITPTDSQREKAILIDQHKIVMVEKTSGYCRALVPEDWSFTSVAPYVGADALSPDQGSHAAWGITSIFKALYPTPEAALNYLITAVGYSGFSLTGNPVDIGNGFILEGFTSTTGRQGQLLYKVYDVDPTFFIISVYLGATLSDQWEAKGAAAMSTAISIRCVSQLRPSTSGLDLGSSDPSNPADNPEVDLSEEWSEAILGYENVYSPTTGEHFMAPLDSYWDTGPDGGGYYRELPGGGYELLQDGFGDY